MGTKMNFTKDNRRTYDIGEVARLLGIGRNQGYEAAHRGDFPTIKIGKRLLVPKAALDRLLEAEAKPSGGT